MAFNDVQATNVSTFLDQLLTPIVQPLNQNIVPPALEVVRLFTQKLPVINETIPQLLGVSWNQNTADVLEAALTDIQNYQGITEQLQGALVFGSFALENVDLRSVPLNAVDLSKWNATGSINQNIVSKLESDITALLPGTWTFPLFDNPTSALGLFSGVNVTLVQYASPLMSFTINNPPLPDIPIPFFPSLAMHVGVNNLTISGQVALGYDTAGFLDDPANPDPLNGFYVYSSPNDPDPAKRVMTELQISGGISLDLTLNGGLVAVGVGGSIDTGNSPATFSLDDTHTHQDQNNNTVNDFDTITIDGNPVNVVRYTNLQYLVGQGVICPLFNASGELGFSLNGYVRIGIQPFAYQISQDFGFIPVFNLANLCAMPNQTLASFDPSTGTLVLDWASLAGLRTVDQGPQPNETFDVAPVADPQHPGQFIPGEVTVSAFGYSQVFGVPGANGQAPVKTIVALGEDASDTTIQQETVTIEPHVTANAVLVAGSGQQDLKATLRYLGDGNAWLYGGGAAQNFLYGGNGQNVMIGGDNGTLGDGYLGDPRMPNVLVGGTGPSSQNLIVAQQGGATLTAGPNNGDILIAGSG